MMVESCLKGLNDVFLYIPNQVVYLLNIHIQIRVLLPLVIKVDHLQNLCLSQVPLEHVHLYFYWNFFDLVNHLAHRPIVDLRGLLFKLEELLVPIHDKSLELANQYRVPTSEPNLYISDQLIQLIDLLQHHHLKPHGLENSSNELFGLILTLIIRNLGLYCKHVSDIVSV